MLIHLVPKFYLPRSMKKNQCKKGLGIFRGPFKTTSYFFFFIAPYGFRKWSLLPIVLNTMGSINELVLAKMQQFQKGCVIFLNFILM